MPAEVGFGRAFREQGRTGQFIEDAVLGVGHMELEGRIGSFRAVEIDEPEPGIVGAGQLVRDLILQAGLLVQVDAGPAEFADIEDASGKAERMAFDRCRIGAAFADCETIGRFGCIRRVGYQLAAEFEHAAAVSHDRPLRILFHIDPRVVRRQRLGQGKTPG